MKKKLLLALMALLPLAGWSDNTTVTLYDFTVPYGTEVTVGNLPDDAWQVTGDLNKEQVAAYLTFARVDDGSATWNSNNVGVYSWTLTKAADTDGHTIYLSSNNAKLTISKANNAVTNAPSVDAGGAYKAAGYDLVATVPTVKFGTVKYLVTDNGTVPAANAAGWTTTAPHVAKPGIYYVYIMVDEDNVNGNYNALAPQKIAVTNSVEIEGTEIPAAEYTLPTALGAAIPFDNTAHALATAGSLSDEHPHCTGIEYSLDEVAWSTSVPTATAAQGYTVYYRILGIEGWYDKIGSVDATISPAAPTVTAATGATGLVYTGEAQELLSAAGSATLGATPKYQISINNGAYGEPLAYAAVTGTAAGTYKIKTVVPGVGNYIESYALTGDDPTVVTVTIAGAAAFTAAPTAANPTWNNTAQDLIVPGANTVAGKVHYKVEGVSDYSTAIPQAINAGTYTVKYKVVDSNYDGYNVEQTITAKINKKVLSVKVNDVTKTYDASVALPAVSPTSFTYIGRIDGDALDVSGVTYAAVTQKNAGEYKDVLTAANLPESNYDYTIIPGTLTINKKALTVTADQPLSAVYHEAYDISGEYTYSDFATGESADNVFATGKTPVLTTNAAATNPEPGDYTIAFTEGVLVANPNYTVTYVIPDNAKFTVTPNPASKIVITVLPKTYTYGDTEDYTNLVAGTDYYVTGLIGDDVLTKAPTFSRSDATNFNAGTYDLIAENAAVADPSKYPGGIIYNNSTVEIEEKEITVTVNPQTIVVGDDAAALAQLDQDAWSVTGLVYDDTKASLKGAVENMLTPKATAAGAVGTVNDGIQFAFDNDNYVLASPVTGKLIVIAADALALDCSKADNATKIAAQNNNTITGGVTIDFSARNGRELPADKARTWKANTWNTLVLPFDITVAELSNVLGYAIVNVIDPSRTTVSGTASKFYGKLTMKGANDKEYIPANTPIMVKTADDIDGVVDFGERKIIAPADADALSVDAGGGAKFTGTYTTEEVSGADNAEIWFLMGNSDSWAYIGAGKTATWNILPFEAFIDMSSSPASSFTFYFEEFDGSVTAIKSVEAEGADDAESAEGAAAEGWYTINGIKLNAKPTQKGIYIYNGKKIAIQ